MENSDARRANRAAVLQMMVTRGVTSRQQIVRSSGLSKATVSRLVRQLVGDGLVGEGPLVSGPDGGRATQTLEFRGESGVVAGVDMGGTSTRFVLTDHRARLLRAWRLPTARPDSPVELADWLAGQLHDACDRAGSARPGVTVVGVPGVVDAATRGIRHAPNLPVVAGTAFAERLDERLDGSLHVHNDSHLALVGELCAGAAAGARGAVMITIGTGVGAGVAVDGRLLTGAGGFIGEIGMLPVELDGTCLEDVVSGGAITAAARARGLRDDSPAAVLALPSDDGPTGVGGTAGDPAANLRTRVLAALFTACVAVTVAYEPEVVVFGGGVSASLGPALSGLRDRLHALLGPGPDLVVSTLGDPAGALGAVATGLEAAYQQLGAAAGGIYDERLRRDLTELARRVAEGRTGDAADGGAGTVGSGTPNGEAVDRKAADRRALDENGAAQQRHHKTSLRAAAGRPDGS